MDLGSQIFWCFVVDGFYSEVKSLVERLADECFHWEGRGERPQGLRRYMGMGGKVRECITVSSGLSLPSATD